MLSVTVSNQDELWYNLLSNTKRWYSKLSWVSNQDELWYNLLWGSSEKLYYRMLRFQTKMSFDIICYLASSSNISTGIEFQTKMSFDIICYYFLGVVMIAVITSFKPRWALI